VRNVSRRRGNGGCCLPSRFRPHMHEVACTRVSPSCVIADVSADAHQEVMPLIDDGLPEVVTDEAASPQNSVLSGIGCV